MNVSASVGRELKFSTFSVDDTKVGSDMSGTKSLESHGWL